MGWLFRSFHDLWGCAVERQVSFLMSIMRRFEFDSYGDAMLLLLLLRYWSVWAFVKSFSCLSNRIEMPLQLSRCQCYHDAMCLLQAKQLIECLHIFSYFEEAFEESFEEASTQSFL